MTGNVLLILMLLTLNSCNNSGVQKKTSIADTSKIVTTTPDKKIKDDFETNQMASVLQ